MSKSTLVVVTPNALIRAELRHGRKAGVQTVWQMPRPAETDDVPALVGACLRQGPPKVGNVWVLCSDFWLDVIEMPPSSVVGLSDDEVASALGFEAEPISGIPPFDSQVGFVKLESETSAHRFWITQTTTFDLNRIDQIVSHAGGKLLGLSHPAGLPRPLDPHAVNYAWHRLELWSDRVVTLEGQPPAALDLRVLHANPQEGRWEGAADDDEATRVMSKIGHHEFLSLDGEGHGHSGYWQQAVSLQNETEVKTWLSAWAACLSEKSPPIPVLRPAVKPMSTRTRGMIAAGLGTVAAGVCFAHTMYMQSQADYYQQQVAQLERPIEQLAALEKRSKELLSKRDELTEQLHSIQSTVHLCEGTFAAQRTRVGKLLEVLAQNRPEALLIKQIEGKGQEWQVHGVCLEPRLANQLASSLARRLASFGWRVQPPHQEAQHALENGGPWKFTLVIEEVELSAEQLLAAAKERNRVPQVPDWQVTPAMHRVAQSEGE